MKKIYLFILAISISSFAIAQQAERYCDEVFTEVEVQSDVVYGKNISILPPAGLLDLKLDIYTGKGDDATDRPVVLVAHTGSFLPPFYNGQATGWKTDSSVVEICTRLAKRGYVAMAYDYRQGWLPLATDPDTRKSTIIQAAYRGIQDTRTAIRFLRKTADEGSNYLGIDPSKITVWGLGTGGYLSMGAATVNDPNELKLAKFIGSNTFPYVIPEIFGDIYGTSTGTHPTNGATLCVPNHVGFSSDFALCVSMGGALGDASWLTGDESEPPMIGVHCPTDIFGPYSTGDVIVPTTQQLVISQASGVKGATALANAAGNNSVFDNIASVDDPIGLLNESNYGSSKFTEPSGDQIDLTTDNFYPFYTGNPLEGAPWEWWDLNTVTALVDIINARDTSAHLSAATIHGSGLYTNPNMSAEKARKYIDTTMMLVLPRMSMVFGLGCTAVDVTDLEPSQVGLEVFPNPAQEVVNFNTNSDAPFQTLFVYDINGRLIKAITNIDSNIYQMDRNNLPSGVYFAKLTFEEGVTTQKIILE